MGDAAPKQGTAGAGTPAPSPLAFLCCFGHFSGLKTVLRKRKRKKKKLKGQRTTSSLPGREGQLRGARGRSEPLAFCTIAPSRKAISWEKAEVSASKSACINRIAARGNIEMYFFTQCSLLCSSVSPRSGEAAAPPGRCARGEPRPRDQGAAGKPPPHQLCALKYIPILDIA